MLAKGQITVSNLDDGKTPFLHQAYKMKDGRFLKHYPVYEASPVNGYKEGDLWHRTDGSQPGYFVANKSNTTLNLNDWTFYANELAYSDTDKFYPKFEGTYSDYNEVASDDQTKYTWKIIKADDGIGIKSVKEYYAVSASNVTPPSLQRDWSETPKPTNTTNKYLWNYEVYTYSNGDTRETTKRVIGTHGATGATGNGITSVTNYYLATTLGTGVTIDRTSTQEWTTAVQKTDPVKKYLWNYEEILYTNGSNIPTAPVIIGTHGEKGDKGAPGINAPTISLSGDSQMIKQDASGNVTPSTSFSVTGVAVNTTITRWLFSVNGGTFGTGLPTGVTRSGNVVKVNPKTVTFNTLSVRADDGTVTDTFTIGRAIDGTKGDKGAKGETGSTGDTGSAGKDAYTVLLSNESHTFQAGTTNAVAGSTTTNIHAYKGTNKVAVTVGTITGMPTGMTITVTNNGTVNAGITFTVDTKMTSPSGVVTIPLTVDGKIFNKEFSYALTFKGQNAVVGLLTNESITLPANKDGLVSNFTGATGVFDVYDGITKKTDSGTAYSVVGQPTNITVNINATTGVYKVTAMPKGTTILNGHATLKAIYNGVTIEKQLNVAKSLTGATGATGAKGATGSRGPVGATGVGVSSVTEYYLATSEPSGIKDTDKRFTTAMQPITATNKYLWNYEKINFSNGTSQPTIPVIIGVYGDKGQTGSTGATGRSITAIQEYYMATSASKDVKRPNTDGTNGWTTTMQPTTETNKYLWNYEKITWSSGTTTTYVEPIIIGVHGAKGPQGPQGASGKDGVAGKDGKGIKSTAIAYATSTSGTTKPATDKWGPTVPSLTKGQYLWTRTIWTYTDNTTETGYSVSYIAKDGNTGKDGLPGKAGVGISSTKIEYAGSTSGTTKPTSGWNTAVPTVAAGSFLWTRTIWTYTDNTTEPGYSVARMGSNGAPGGKGATGATGASATSYWITTSNNIIGKSQTGVINPTTITFKGFSKTGTANSVAYSGRFIIQTSTNGTTYTTRYTTPSNTNQNTCTYTIPANTLFVKCLFYMANGTTVLLDEQTVPIVESAEGIEIGNRNWLVNTVNPSGVNPVYTLGSEPAISGKLTIRNGWTKVEHNTGSSEMYYRFNVPRDNHLGGLIAGKTYTISMTVKGKGTVNYRAQYKTTGNWITVPEPMPSTPLSETEEKTIVFTVKVPIDSTAFYLSIDCKENIAGNYVEFYRPMLVEGNISMPHQPAPEDARTYKAWANSSDGTVDFTRVYPNENLLLGSNEAITTAGYKVKEYILSDTTLTASDDVVITINGYLNTDRQAFGAYLDGGVGGFGTLTKVRDGVYQASRKWTPRDNQTKIELYQLPSNGTSESTVHSIKLERGTVETIYTTNSGDSLSGSMPQYIGLGPLDSNNPSEYEWIINPEYTKALSDETTNEALEDKIAREEFEKLEKIATEFAKSYEAFVSEGGQYVEDAAKLEERFAQIFLELGANTINLQFLNTYFKVGKEGLLIGSEDSQIKMLLTNDRLSFQERSRADVKEIKEIAYFGGQSFTINSGAIVQDFQIGEHKFTNVGGGHTIVQWVTK